MVSKAAAPARNEVGGSRHRIRTMESAGESLPNKCRDCLQRCQSATASATGGNAANWIAGAPTAAKKNTAAQQLEARPEHCEHTTLCHQAQALDAGQQVAIDNMIAQPSTIVQRSRSRNTQGEAAVDRARRSPVRASRIRSKNKRARPPTNAMRRVARVAERILRFPGLSYPIDLRLGNSTTGTVCGNE